MSTLTKTYSRTTEIGCQPDEVVERVYRRINSQNPFYEPLSRTEAEMLIQWVKHYGEYNCHYEYRLAMAILHYKMAAASTEAESPSRSQLFAEAREHQEAAEAVKASRCCGDDNTAELLTEECEPYARMAARVAARHQAA